MKLGAEHRLWVEAYGSPRLKRCLAEGIECTAIYRDERMAMSHPGWVFDDRCPGELRDPRNPPMEAFAMLDKARETEPGAVLAWLQISNPNTAPGQPRWLYTGYVAIACVAGKDILFGVPPEFVTKPHE